MATPRLVPIPGTNLDTIVSVTPSTTPPIKAPGMRPRPPRAVMVYAFRVRGGPMKGKMAWVGLSMAPAAAVMAMQIPAVTA